MTRFNPAPSLETNPAEADSPLGAHVAFGADFEVPDIDDQLHGLAHLSPVISFCLTVYLLSPSAALYVTPSEKGLIGSLHPC